MFSLQRTAAHRIALHGKAMQRIAKQRGQPVSNSRLSEWFSPQCSATQRNAAQSNAQQRRALQGSASQRNALHGTAKQRGKHLATGVCRVVLTHGIAKHRIEINGIGSQGNAAQRKAKRQAFGFAGGFSRQRNARHCTARQGTAVQGNARQRTARHGTAKQSGLLIGNSG